jgi:hypothetical protein
MYIADLSATTNSQAYLSVRVVVTEMNVTFQINMADREYDEFREREGWKERKERKEYVFSMALLAHSGTRPLIQFRNHFSQMIGLLERVISTLQGRYLNT